MTIDEAEKAFIEALDKSMGNLNRGDWYKRKTVRMAFRKGWEQAIEEMKVNNCYTPAVSESVQTVRGDLACKCGNKLFTHRYKNWIECTECNLIKVLQA
jgi:hypothetical protein